ncbi:MAG: alcohol dehydrogenase catalytic domain-containing protein [bacterium]
MKAMRLTGIRAMAMQTVPTPAVTQDNEILIQMTRVGVCGSDVHYYTEGKIGSQVVQYPFTVGHEGAGIIKQVGAAVSKFRPGDHVAIEPAMPCWGCDQCLAGRPHTCRKLKFLGCPEQAEGCLSEYVVMPETSCVALSPSISDDEGALSEPLAIGVYAVKTSIPMRGAKVGILGSGPIGLSILFAARAQGAGCIYVTDKIKARLAMARRAGADWGGNPEACDVVKEICQREPAQLDVVFECCGKQEALDQGIELLKPGGKLMVVGIPPTLDRVSFKIDLLRRKELCIQNVRRQNHCVQPALDMIARREFDVNVMVTHRFPFSQTQAAFDLVAGYENGVVKAMIDF